MTPEDTTALDLAIDAAPAQRRPALAALFALDRRLEQIARHTRDPLLAQMRLTWWYEALSALDAGERPAEPVLSALAENVLAAGVDGSMLAEIANGWEVLLAERPLDAAALQRLAETRGATLFRAAASVLGGNHPGVDPAGEAWALADFGASANSEAERRTAAMMARERLDTALATRWPVWLRPLGLLALLTAASRDGTGARLREAARALRFRLTGR